jgi:hypothetical protein
MEGLRKTTKRLIKTTDVPAEIRNKYFVRKQGKALPLEPT